ncbi:MAG: mechanosensitive ion channel family protein [Gammaproteobacteria bacterium]|nr:mechanosensitive ion channel family protein [Gammaproteobacteria bacterium]MCY4356258.1 mechanosensitive ion channel family protein [Gammaproteobacteria bacterium]
MTTKVLLITAISLIVYWLGKRGISRLVKRVGRDRKVADSRIAYVSDFIGILWSIVVVLSAIAIIGVRIGDLGLFLGSVSAVIGVALFAQWSILSNVTASVAVFFFFPYRVGDHVKIIDGENSIEGVIREITLFHVILTGLDDSTVVTYPNSMVFQKAVSIKSAHRSIPNATQGTTSSE